MKGILLLYKIKSVNKFKFLHKNFGKNKFNLLDIGAGNHSASVFKKVFPNCKYYGVDKDTTYSNDEKDFSLMEEFFEIDLTNDDLSCIPDNFFDAINMTHIIEHLENGDEVIDRLVCKLKSGGMFYIEYPGKRSLTLPHRKGTLNFFDDDTHVRLFDIETILKVLAKKRVKPIEFGVRRNPLFLLTLPLRLIGKLILRKPINTSELWDLYGFAEFVYAKKL